MGEIIKMNRSQDVEVVRTENDLIEITEGISLDVRTDLSSKQKSHMNVDEY